VLSASNAPSAAIVDDKRRVVAQVSLRVLRHSHASRFDQLLKLPLRTALPLLSADDDASADPTSDDVWSFDSLATHKQATARRFHFANDQPPIVTGLCRYCCCNCWHDCDNCV
jgi:hypothetical protein